MAKRLNTTGVWIIANNKDKKIWLGTGVNCETLLKAKLSLCHNYGQGIIQNSFYNAPVEVQADIAVRKGDIVDDIYLITHDMYSILSYIKANPRWSSHDVRFLSSEIRESLRYIAINKLFADYEPYAMRCTIENCETVYNRNRGLVYNMIKEGYIKMYKSTKKEYHLGKSDFGWEEISMLNSEFEYQIQDLCEKVVNASEAIEEAVQEVIEVSDTVAIKENILDSKEIEKLLTIEAILRDTTKEKLIEGIISDKAKEIAKIF